MNRIIEKASWKKAVLFTVVFAIFYIVINLNIAGLLKITEGANILDFEFGYTPDKAHGMLTALGSEGRALYLTRIQPLDFPFPLSYMLFYTAWMALLIKHTVKGAWRKSLLVIPVLAMVFDWIENLGIITMLRNYPKLPTWAVNTGSIGGIVKNICTVGTFVIIGLLLVAFIIKKARKADSAA